MIPSPVVVRHRGIFVVRDDRILGGTKRRFLEQWIASVPEPELVYATPAYGGAQIALAVCARAAGKACTVFVAKRGELHPRTLEAQRAGAAIIEVPHGYLSNVQAKARAHCEERGALLMPHGFDTEAARASVAAAALAVRQEHGAFDEVWSVAGSGVLSRSLQQAELGRSFVAVAVGREAPDVGAARLIRHSQPFGTDARVRPPFPSCSNYDAKAWEHIVAAHGASPKARVLFWNVMG